MSTFAVCTALYEGARAFLPAYLAGLASAAKGEELSLVVAIDDLEAPDAVIAQLETVCPVVAVSAPRAPDRRRCASVCFLKLWPVRRIS